MQANPIKINPRTMPAPICLPHVVEFSSYLPRCFVVRPAQPTNRVLLAIHGISRGAVEQARAWSSIAVKHGLNVVAPLFDRERFGHYQTLNRGRGRDTDTVLQDLLDEIAIQFGSDTSQVVMVGYSGGAQFCHRYALFQPQRIAAMAISAPGWFTYLDSDTPFPHGIGDQEQRISESSVRGFLAIPKLVCVGAKDTNRDSSFRKDKKLLISQGKNRVERAEAWLTHHNRMARHYGVATCLQYKKLPGVSHSFTESVRHGDLIKHASGFFTTLGI
jgi:pimeloyl-ACP methyl ester carboxylesterase